MPVTNSYGAGGLLINELGGRVSSQRKNSPITESVEQTLYTIRQQSLREQQNYALRQCVQA